MATSASKAAPGGPKAVPASGDAAPGNKKSKMLLVIVGAVVLMAGAAGGAWFFLNKNGAANHGAPAAAKEVHAKPPVFMSLETFTVNLQSEENQQFLQANLTLQVADEATVEMLKLQMPHVRNRLLLLLSSKKAADILTVEGKKKLAAEVVEQLKQPFAPHGPTPEVTDVLFTSFVVQ